MSADVISPSMGSYRMSSYNISHLPADQVPFLQRFWAIALENERLSRSPLLPIVLGVSSFFFFTIPFTFLDFAGKNWNWVKRYRIQPNKEVTWPVLADAAGLTLWNQILYILPVSIAQWVWTPDTVLPTLAPSLWTHAWQLFVCLVIYDTEIFFWHMLHHRVRFLYRRIHSVHHRPSVVNCWVSQYVHPWELFCVAFFSTTAPWLLHCHPMTEWSFMVLNTWLGVETHCGYDFPVMPHRWLPFFGGGTKHEMHHQRPLVNFQPYFTWLDRLFGTDCPGQRAGGIKSKELLDYERKEK